MSDISAEIYVMVNTFKLTIQVNMERQECLQREDNMNDYYRKKEKAVEHFISDCLSRGACVPLGGRDFLSQGACPISFHFTSVCCIYPINCVQNERSVPSN